MSNKSELLERAIREVTTSLNGQYPRPWMTSLSDPADADVFTVGKNQRNGFDVEKVGSHDHFVDSLFNKGTETCRQLYDRIVVAPSPTRRNTDSLVAMLHTAGVTKVLETNVVCYSTPMSADLRKQVHAGGTQRGTEIFNLLLSLIQPRVIIAHGSDTAKRLGRALGQSLPKPSVERCHPTHTQIGKIAVFVIPSLAPPQFNKWSSWAGKYLADVSEQTAALLRRSREE